MRKNLTKTAAILVMSAMVAASALTACGSKAEEPEAETEETEEVSEEDPEEAAEEETEADAEETEAAEETQAQ